MAAADVAQRLIAKKGRDVTLRRNIGADPVEPGKPWLGDLSGRAVFLGTTDSDAILALGAGRVLAAVRAGATAALVAAKGLPWALDSRVRVVDGARTWSVVEAELLRPGADAVLYTLALRG